MRSINKPPFDALKFFLTCVEGVGSSELKKRFVSWQSRVENAGDFYDELSEKHELFHLVLLYNNGKNSPTVPFISKIEFKKLYENQMVRENRPGRSVYEKLLITKNKRCPFCSVGTVKNLDHFLPKALFPIYSVIPINLVPSCRDCNLDKNAEVALERRKQTLHPYYDDVSTVQWLFARVAEETIPPVVEYYVDNSSVKPIKLALKVEAHFEGYNLGETFTDKAADRLSEIYIDCKNRFEREGRVGLETFLLEQKKSCEGAYKNSWLVGMYGALHSSEWFCKGGFIE